MFATSFVSDKRGASEFLFWTLHLPTETPKNLTKVLLSLEIESNSNLVNFFFKGIDVR